MKKILLVFLLTLLASCSVPSQNPMATPTIQPAVTLFPIVTSTFALTPTFTPSATPAPLPPRIPLPTLSGEEDFLNFISFIGKDNCQLPCWAGIIPGKTSWDGAVFALRPMESVAKMKTYLNIESLFGKGNVVTWTSSGDGVIVNGDVGTIMANQNVVNLVSVNIEGWTTPNPNAPLGSLPLPKRFDLQSVLVEYGIPSMVFIYTFIHYEQGPLPFQILLIYPEHKFYIEYHRDARLNGNSVMACDPDFYLRLTIVDDKEKLVSTNSINRALETKDLGLQNMKTVEQVLNISPAKFYEIYSLSNPECISIPVSLWQQ